MNDTTFGYAKPSEECDLIMKGGITSGVVFPRAITELATRYRFMHIGGTSAGAIAAVMTAAAEYRRQTGATVEEKNAGFALIDGMPGELAANFQPSFSPLPTRPPSFASAWPPFAPSTAGPWPAPWRRCGSLPCRRCLALHPAF
ncbi:UNVERIFIED_ORG: hypothetical protein J2W85_000938 [Ensifer adhaerens]|nr:hypothetical protein [Ensifer adhaerens]